MLDRNHDISNRDIDDLRDKQFLGVVELIDDPRKEGRARVRVYSIHDDLPAEDIPWAYPKNKSLFFGQGGKAGSLSVPKVGSIVAIRFDNGNPYSPEYFAIHELAQDVKDELNTEYEGSHIVLFDGDQELKLWFSVSKGLTISVKGASINLAPDNLITVKTDNKVVIDSPNIELGASATESVIKGTSFKTFFDSHVHPTAGSPPALPMPTALLSKTSKTK
jgi:Type VI secretion system/phage-baseplate injector OB domain